MTCDRPIRDRNGEELPGVTCNLSRGHLGKCAQMYDAAMFFDKNAPGVRYSELPIFTDPHTPRSITETALRASDGARETSGTTD